MYCLKLSNLTLSSVNFQTMDQVIKLEKTYQQRLQEYTEIFSKEGPYSLAKIKHEFSFFLELLVERNGWQAVWKIPRVTCEDLGVSFPTVVLVFVENVDLEKLLAAVKVVAVLDDIHLPEMHVVNLVELWPLKQRDEASIFNISNALDIVRFFYMNLYMPWDEDEDETSDWVEHHLENRLQLFYDLKNGILPRNMAEHLRSLLTTAKHLRQCILKEDREEELIELQVSLLEIKKEVELLENPLARKVLIKRAANPKNAIGGNCWLILGAGTADDYFEFINEARKKIKILDQTMITLAPNISEALNVGTSGDVFVLKKGSHEINHMGALEGGGTLISISEKEETKIVSLNNSVVFDFSADVQLEGLTIHSTAQCALLVRNGKTTLKNCTIIDDSHSYSRQGLAVLSGAQVELQNCSFIGFEIAVIANKGSSITVENCEIADVSYGLKINDYCSVKLVSTSICNCRQYGIWVETEERSQNKQMVGGCPILKEYVLVR